MLQPKVGRPHITLLESLQLKKKRNQKNFNDPTPEFLKNGPGSPGGRGPKTLSGALRSPNYFHNNTNRLFAFLLSFPHECTMEFSRTI